MYRHIDDVILQEFLSKSDSERQKKVIHVQRRVVKKKVSPARTFFKALMLLERSAHKGTKIYKKKRSDVRVYF